MGPLLSDLTRKMQAKIEKGEADPTKILIHSTHDTCLAGLVSTLEVFDEKSVLRCRVHGLQAYLYFSIGGQLSQLPLHLSCSRCHNNQLSHLHPCGRTPSRSSQTLK